MAGLFLTVILSFLLTAVITTLVVLTYIAQWKIHALLGCRWKWYIFIPVLNRIQILDMMKSDNDTIEVFNKEIPYHVMSLYDSLSSVVLLVTFPIGLIPFIGGLVQFAIQTAVLGFIGRYYNARLIALLYGESPDDYGPYLNTGFWWSIFPFLPYFWLKKNTR